jgi:flagellar biosynthetic protein FliO
MTVMSNGKRKPSVGLRARLNHVLSIILVVNLTSAVVAWGAESQQQLAVEQHQSLIFTGLKMVGALALILGLMLLSLHFLKRYRSCVRSRSPESHVQVLDVRMLAPKKSIALVEIAGERLLLGVGTETVTMLSRIDFPPRQISPEAEKQEPGFASTLLQTLRRRTRENLEAEEASVNSVQKEEGQVGIRTSGDAGTPIRPSDTRGQARGYGDAEKKQLTMLK